MTSAKENFKNCSYFSSQPKWLPREIKTLKACVCVGLNLKQFLLRIKCAIVFEKVLEEKRRGYHPSKAEN